MDIFAPIKAVGYICTMGWYNPWKKDENYFPDDIVHLTIGLDAFTTDKKFAKAWDKIFSDKNEGHIIKYIAPDVPWQAYFPYCNWRKTIGNEPFVTFSDFSGEEMVEKFKEDRYTNVAGLLDLEFADKVMAEEAFCILDHSDATSMVWERRGLVLREHRYRKLVAEAIAEGKLPERCPNETCRTSLFKIIPDSDGDCQVCGNWVGDNGDEIMEEIYDSEEPKRIA